MVTRKKWASSNKKWGENTRVEEMGSVGATPGASFAAKLRIAPDDNVIIGAENILRYLGIGSLGTLWRWVELYGLPAIKRPDGLWMTTMTAIDQWIFLAAEVVNDGREYGHCMNVRAEMAIKRLENQIEGGKFVEKQRVAAKTAAKGVGLLDGRKEPRRPYTGRSDIRKERYGTGLSENTDTNEDGVHGSRAEGEA